MKGKDIRVCVLRIEGTNCEEEAYQAFKSLGASPEKVHIKQILGTSPQEMRRDLQDYQVLMFPGGFSAGDYVRAGAIFAARLKSKLTRQLEDFVSSGKPVLGVCNGFQIMVELGLLPAFEEPMSAQPQAALSTNVSGRFECRPAYLKHENGGSCVFTSNIPRGKVVMFPCAHAEGNLRFPHGKEEEYVRRLEENDQIVFKYVDPRGKYAGYPWNPNGSIENIAAICNPAGNVMGIMPHPERVQRRYLHPDWTRTDLDPSGRGDGLAVFESALEYVKRKF
jgi:phosphoribosylformylglycinamidine synthase I